MRKDHYDILLFENQENSANHKYDMYLIGRMLQNNGLKVAVVDVYGQDSQIDEHDGIEVIHPITNSHVPNNSFFRNPRLGKINNLLYDIFLSHYFRKVMSIINPMADMFYCGSYNHDTPKSLLQNKKPSFFWGLRSSRVGRIKDMIKQDWFIGGKLSYLRRFFYKNKYNYFFYSNDIIKKEFIDLGIPEYRLLHREERCVDNNAMFVKSDEQFSILSIGQLRHQKHIETIIKSFVNLDDSEAKYYIIGKSYNDYEPILSGLYEGHNNIMRRNEKLDDEEFNSYFDKAHYLVLADEKAPSSVTNGTMMEALIHRRPVVAPDYNPYSYYVNKYGVGLLYNPEEPNSLLEALRDARRVGYMSFREKIEEFLKTLSFEVNAKQLSEDIRRIQQDAVK